MNTKLEFLLPPQFTESEEKKPQHRPVPVNPADELLLQTKIFYGEADLETMRGLTLSEIIQYGPKKELILACLEYCCGTAMCDLDPEVQAEIHGPTDDDDL